jgi:sulfonate transport system substrate-binding protein
MLKEKVIILFSILCAAIVSNGAAAPTKVRIGWQIPWATQGQIVQIWKHTDILKKNGIEAEFIGRTFGPELNELALSDSVDVILTADQPAATLFSKDKGWVGIGRLMYNRTPIYVPPKSSIKTVTDLKGKTLGLPLGAAAERTTLQALEKEKLSAKEVTLINVDIKEQGALVRADKDKTKWKNFDALAGFDPIPAILEAEGVARVIHSGKVVSMVLMSEKAIKKTSDLPTKTLKALVEAYDYYRLHTEEADKWFLEESHLEDPKFAACKLSASMEPNLTVSTPKEIRVSFNEEDFKTMQSAADFIAPKIGTKVDMKKYVSNKYSEKIK